MCDAQRGKRHCELTEHVHIALVKPSYDVVSKFDEQRFVIVIVVQMLLLLLLMLPWRCAAVVVCAYAVCSKRCDDTRHAIRRAFESIACAVSQDGKQQGATWRRRR
jgi:hypothetical protein